jgi:hypothetical protein
LQFSAMEIIIYSENTEKNTHIFAKKIKTKDTSVNTKTYD